MSRSRTRGAEVQGQALDAVVTAVSALAPATRMRVQSILAEEDVLHVSPGEWYPLGEYTDTLQSVERAVGSSVLRRIGQQLPVVTFDATETTDPGGALRGLDAAYAVTHRGSAAGGYEFQETGTNAGEIVSTTPYPDAFDRGVLDATFAGRTATDVYARVTPAAGFGTDDSETYYDISW